MNSNNMAPGLGRLCAVVQAGALLGGALTLALPLWFWSDPALIAEIGPQMAGMPCQAVTVDARTPWFGAAASVLPLALALAFFVLLWRLFAEYRAGRALTPPAQRLLLHLARALLAMALLQPFVRALMSVVLTLANPPGQRMVVFGFGNDDYVGVVVALALLAIATVMRQAVQAAEENRGFV